MPTPFASLEARLNAVTLKKTANATALINGVEVDGVFSNGYEQVAFGVGMADTNPTFRLPTDAVPADPVDTTIAIDGVGYIIKAHEPDGTGMTILRLEEA